MVKHIATHRKPYTIQFQESGHSKYSLLPLMSCKGHTTRLPSMPPQGVRLQPQSTHILDSATCYRVVKIEADFQQTDLIRYHLLCTHQQFLKV